MEESERDTITARDIQVMAAIAPAPRGVPIAELTAPRTRLRAFADACRIVARAHAAGFVHGALTPRAILVDELGETHVVRWGDERGGQPAEDVRALVAILGAIAPELGALETRTAHELGEHVLAYLDTPRPPPPVEEVRRQSRVGMLALGAYLIFGPAFLWLGSGAPGYALILLVLVAANLVVLWLQGVGGHRPRPALVAAGNVALVALIARTTSPFLLAPGIAAITTMAISFSPMYVRGRRVVALAAAMTGAVLVPWLAERVGWLAPTTTPTHDGFVLAAAGLHLREGGQIVLMVLYTIALVSAGAVIAFNLARTRRAAR